MGNKQVVTTKLSDLCELIVDCPHSTPEWTDSGFIVLRNQNIRNGSLDLSSPSFTDENGYNSRIKRAVPQAGDIVLTREAPMGEVCLIPEGLKCCLGQRQVLLRPKRDVSGEYLFWALQSPFVRHQISWSEGTGTTVSNIRIPVLKAFEIPRWFESEPQIASHLSAIKNKITLNQKINQTLEQMAQTLFKSWFVDFDPVVDNALDAGFFEQDLAFPDELLCRAETRRKVREQRDFKPLPDATRQLFPAAFEECAEPSLGLGGWVPQGWNVAVSGEHIDVRDGTHDSPKKSEHGFPLVTSKNLTSGRLNLTSAYLITPKDYNEVNKRSKVNHGDILLTMIGTLGIPCLVSTKDVNFAIKNIGLFKTSETPHLKSYFFELLKSQGMQQFLDSRAAGTTQKYLSLKVLRTINFVLPCSEVLSGFNKLIQSYENKIQLNDERNSVLANLLDTLLPKLVSGELHLYNIEADLAKEGVA